MSDLELFRKHKDEFLRTHPQSPLNAEQRRAFTGLSYYPEDDGLRFHLRPEPVEGQAEVRMQTTTGGEQAYRRAAVVRFEVEGEEAILVLYAGGGPGLFLPFRDATSGKETYGGGRYLDLDPPASDGTIEVDFNVAYNPYCAYKRSLDLPAPASGELAPGAHPGG